MSKVVSIFFGIIAIFALVLSVYGMSTLSPGMVKESMTVAYLGFFTIAASVASIKFWNY